MIEITGRTKLGRMVQGSPEWHAFRSGHCNASEAAAARSRSPFVPRNPQQLTEVRSGVRKVFVTQAMNYGHEYEPVVREWLEATYLELIQPQVWHCIASFTDHAGITHSIPMACSVDGLDQNGVLYEIKCPSSPNSETVVKAKEGKIPLYYQDQIQHQLLVTGANECCFAVRDPSDGQVHTVWVQRDEQHQRAIVADWAQVWPYLRDGKTITPPEGDLEFDAMAEAFIAAKQAAEEAEAAMNEIRDKLIEYATKDGGKTIVSKTFGVTVTKAKRAGTVNYKAIPELQGVDLDKYRSEGTEYWTVKAK